MKLLEAVAKNSGIDVHVETADFRQMEDCESMEGAWLFHIYKCSECDLNFAVDQKFEEQDAVHCPVCLTDHAIEDQGQSIMCRRR